MRQCIHFAPCSLKSYYGFKHPPEDSILRFFNTPLYSDSLTRMRDHTKPCI